VEARAGAPLETGALLAGRYRIVGPLGSGGMGEVFRAEDIKLGQHVAIKFLPPSLASDPARRARLYEEVRVARQVTHPNVCRVHDVGEVDGLHFLTMEYVDGEDLASLLRRIGRLPQDKGIEVARQVCIGLAAAHERGVVHRDLKPANVMIDGQGRARLTDFGLAVLADHVHPGEIAGTPAYMAPEQFTGESVTPRTDVYALGLVMYEIFTGRRAFPVPTAPATSPPSRAAPPPPPSSVVPDLDPALERVILACLEKEPQARPASAISVAARLPGGDPLAAMVAAGQTPDPDIVAAAGGAGRLPVHLGLAALLTVFVGVPLGMKFFGSFVLFEQVPLPKRPEVLDDRAREIATELGGPSAIRAIARGFEYSERIQKRPVRMGEKPRGAPIEFWYRDSRGRLDPLGPTGNVTLTDPPLLEAGMRRVRLDPSGRLLALEIVPADPAAPTTPVVPSEADWTAAFTAAGLDLAQFTAVSPRASAPLGATARFAWDGPAADDPPRAVHVEAARAGGHTIFFRVCEDGDPLGPPLPESPPTGARNVRALVQLLSLVGAVALAWRNLRAGRGDRRGALRVGAAVGVFRFTAWLLTAPHTLGVSREMTLFSDAVGRALYSALTTALFYLAIEPLVRRRWPRALISWTRLVAGRVRDPLVGRDVLFGMAYATLFALGLVAVRSITARSEAPELFLANLDFLAGPRFLISWVLLNAHNAVQAGLFFVLCLLGFRILIRHETASVMAAILLIAFFNALGIGARGPVELGYALAVALAMYLLVVRGGLLAVITVTFFVTAGRLQVPPTLRFDQWYSLTTVTWLGVWALLAVWAFWTATGGLRLRSDVLE
jgi:hypothetical protein